MRLKLYGFRDSHLLYSLYVFLSSVILWYIEALGLKKFLTKGQRGIRNACTRNWYTIGSIFLYNLEVHPFCAYTLEFLGGMQLLQNR